MSSIDQLFGTKRISDPSKYVTSDPLEYEKNPVQQTVYHYFVPKNKVSTTSKVIIVSSLILGGFVLWNVYKMWKKIKKLERAIKYSKQIEIKYDDKDGVILEDPDYDKDKYFNNSYFDSIKEINENDAQENF